MDEDVRRPIREYWVVALRSIGRGRLDNDAAR